jgi:proteic killer suppression protein
MASVIFFLKMIQSFKDAATKELFETGLSRRWASIEAVAIRRLDQIENAVSLGDLRLPPGNRLETLRGDRAGQYSIRVNKQYRICFVWKADGAHEVEIADYH